MGRWLRPPAPTPPGLTPSLLPSLPLSSGGSEPSRHELTLTLSLSPAAAAGAGVRG